MVTNMRTREHRQTRMEVGHRPAAVVVVTDPIIRTLLGGTVGGSGSGVPTEVFSSVENTNSLGPNGSPQECRSSTRRARATKALLVMTIQGLVLPGFDPVLDQRSADRRLRDPLADPILAACRASSGRDHRNSGYPSPGAVAGPGLSHRRPARQRIPLRPAPPTNWRLDTERNGWSWPG